MQDFGILGPWRQYGQSKLANIVYATELAHRYPNIMTASVHPGVVKPDLVGTLGLVDKAFVYAGNFGNVIAPQEDVLNQSWAATGSKKGTIENGAVYMPVGIQSKSKLESTAKDHKLATKLWEWTEESAGRALNVMITT